MRLTDLIRRMTTHELICLKRDIERMLDVRDRNSDIDISNLDLSVRAYNVLKNGQIKSLYEIAEYTPSDFMKIRNAGNKSFKEITKLMVIHGLCWKV